MPVDVLPEYAPVTVEVQTEALGLSSAEVEQLITVPIEQDLLNGVAFLKDIRSQSVPGMSRIFLVFEPGTDLFTARQVVAERMTQAHALPNVSKPPQILQPLSSTNRVLMVGVNSKTLIADPDVGARPLDDRPAPARRARRRQRLHLGRARAAAAGAGRSAEAERRQRLAAAGDRHLRQRALGVAADLPGSVDPRHRRVHRHGQPAARHSAHLADHDAAVALAASRSRARR